MRLKSIELHGFKSFARKTIIKFDEQFSVIVGPNGCGKSNISDAIRWVLGEQSAKNLRGNKMEDVVFAGSSNLNAMNYCKVSIKFDNRDKTLPIDYSEVEVARTAYRSGESKYTINNSNVRLKDIRELFMDTGLGKEGYSIISQGRIDEILSAKSEDRRALLDEAAGVSKYKYKRDESIKKLDNTINNLNRIDDIMGEVERNRLYLKKEAEKAEKALQLKEELLIAELTYYKIKSSEISDSLKELKEDISKEEKEYNFNKKELEKAKTKSTSIYNEIEILDARLKDDKQELDSVEKAYNNTYTALQINKQKINSITKDISRIEKEISDRETKFKDYEIKISEDEINKKELSEKTSSLNYTLEKNKTKLNKLKEEYDRLILDYEKFKTEFSQAKDEFNKLELSKKTNTELIKAFEEDIVNLRSAINEKLSQKNEISKELDELLDNYESLTFKIDELTSGKNQLENNLKESKEKINNFIQDINLLSSKIEKLESNHKILTNLQNNYEGFYKPVQRFLKEANKNEEIRNLFLNPLADEIKVKSGYEKAVEYALGSQVQNIITRKTSDAEKLIAYLKKNNIGRLTFLPIDRYKSYPRDLGSLNENDFLSFGPDVLSFSNEIKPIIDSLLGRTIFVENMKQATIISKKSKNRIVTLDGDIVNVAGSIVGGSNKSNSYNLINRKKETKALEEDIKKCKEKLMDLEKLLSEEKNNFLSHTNSYKEIEYKISNSTNNKSKLEKDKNDLSLQINILTNEIENISNDITIKKEKISNFDTNDEVNKIYDESYIKAQKELLLKKEVNINKVNNSMNDLEKLIFKDQNIYDTNERDLRIINNNINNIENDKINKNSIILNLKNELSLLKIDNKELEVLIKSNKSDLDVLDKKKSKFEDKYLENDSRLKENRLTYDKLNKRTLELLDITSKLKLSLNRKETFYDNQLSKINDLKQAIIETYNFTEEVFHEKLIVVEDKFISEKEIKNIRRDFSRISNYNEDAIDEFNEINEQYEFYINQKNDLLKAKDDVELVIKNLEKQIEIEFKNSFETINSNFSRIFSTLFEGGNARLILDNKGLLTSGVDIEAKLPGKNMQNLSLLSGGERALIAVSLLFAIFETNPAPFCILDESDAALDESNITRYIEYLRSFSDIQFIIITHRKTTMEIANCLYGVTMEEDGISKVIKLELDKAKSI